MQILNFTMLGRAITASFDVESSDEMSAMVVSPEDFQALVEEIAVDQQDGRGCRMNFGAFTPLGVSMALESIGIAVGGLQQATSDDLDGDSSDDSSLDMLESAPSHVQRHRMLLDMVKNA